MLLIILLGLIAKLTSVSGDCDVGSQDVKDFDFARATGTWYVLLHSNNTYEDNFKCVVATYEPPAGNSSSVTLKAYDISAQSYATLNGNVTNLNSTGFDELFQGPTIWNGRYYVIATDYDSYIILKLCSFESNQLYVYVAYRSNRPNKKTVHRVKKELRENNIDIRQLVDWPADNCQQA